MWFNEEYISKIHAKFIIIEKEIFIQDIDSLNGIWLRLS